MYKLTNKKKQNIKINAIEYNQVEVKTKCWREVYFISSSNIG